MKLKNTIKTFLVAGLVACVPAIMVGCGEKGLVDTSGNYQAVTDMTQVEQLAENVTNLATTTKGFEFNINVEGERDGQYNSLIYKGTYDVSTGDLLFDAVIESPEQNLETTVYYHAAGDNWYVNNNGIYSNADIMESLFSMVRTVINPEYAQLTIESPNGEAEFAIASNNSGTKLRISLTQTTLEANTDINYYALFDSEGHFYAYYGEATGNAIEGNDFEYTLIEFTAIEEGVTTPDGVNIS